MLNDRSIVVEEGFLPISTKTCNLVAIDICDVVWIGKVCHLCGESLLTVDVLLVHQHCIVGSSGHVALLPCALPTIREIVIDGCLAKLTLLGGNEDYTIGGSRSVDSTRGSILQHFHRLNVGWIDRFHSVLVGWHTVDDVKRFGVVDSTNTTHANH